MRSGSIWALLAGALACLAAPLCLFAVRYLALRRALDAKARRAYGRKTLGFLAASLFATVPLLAWQGALALPAALELLVVAIAGAALFRLARGGAGARGAEDPLDRRSSPD